MRRCGDCSLCCKLIAVNELAKLAGERCVHQKFRKGCAIYASKPDSCHFWSCRWLVEDDTADLSRPDRSHFVVDIMPDYIKMIDSETGEERIVQAVQIWIDPDYRAAHRDPTLRAYVERRAREQIVTIIRFGPRDGFVLFAPEVSSDRQWHEVEGTIGAREYSLEDVARALGGAPSIVFSDEPARS